MIGLVLSILYPVNELEAGRVYVLRDIHSRALKVMEEIHSSLRNMEVS